MLDEGYEYSKYDFQDDIEKYLDSVFNVGFEKVNMDLVIMKAYILNYFFKYEIDGCYIDKVKDAFKNLRYNHDTFIINLDIIAMGIEKQKHNFENFETIVDDVIGLNIKCNNLDYYINSVVPVIIFILNDENYKNDKNMREYLFCVLRSLDDEEKCNRLLNCFEFCENENVSFGGDRYSLFDYHASLYTPLKAMYIGDRYFYLLDKLLNEDNVFFREYFLDNFEELSCDLFNELDNSLNIDSFKKCVDIIFDSDSYSEFKNKIDSICHSDSLFNYGSPKLGLESALMFFEKDFKTHYCEEKVSYPEKTMNRVNKPKRIIDRMKYLYSRIDDSVSYDFFDDIYKNSKSLGKFNEDISEETKKRKTIWGRIKSKIKKK